MRYVSIAAAAWLLLAWPAAAADSDAGASTAANSVWNEMLGALAGGWATVTGRLGAPDPFDYLPEQLPLQGQSFLGLMDTAGYRLAGIDTSGSILAHVDYRFVQERTPSADDLDRVRRGLAIHRGRYGGAMAAVQGRVLQGVLAVADTPGFQVTAIDVEALPWPGAIFHLTAADRPLTTGEQQILDELRRSASPVSAAP
jgi:hypothetical protein